MIPVLAEQRTMHFATLPLLTVAPTISAVTPIVHARVRGTITSRNLQRWATILSVSIYPVLLPLAFQVFSFLTSRPCCCPCADGYGGQEYYCTNDIDTSHLAPLQYSWEFKTKAECCWWVIFCYSCCAQYSAEAHLSPDHTHLI